jgi:hypothetical protein
VVNPSPSPKPDGKKKPPPLVTFDLASRCGLESLESMRGMCEGQSAIVCGLGPSIGALPDKEILAEKGISTFGVNDIYKYHPVDYLFLIDQPIVFTPDRIKTIMASGPRYWFMGSVARASWDHEYESKNVPPALPMQVVDTGLLPGKRLTTPSLACGLALFLGFKRIGLIGVDIIGHKVLEKHIDNVNVIFTEVLSAAWLVRAGIVNLSPMNALPILPRMTLPDFLSGKHVTHFPRRQKKHTRLIRHFEKGALSKTNDPRWREIAEEVRT